MKPDERTCDTCGAFFGTRMDERLGKVGSCALQVFPDPVRSTGTCTRYRPKGAVGGAAPRPRAAGEPRRYARGAPTGSPGSRSPSAPDEIEISTPLPQEIDIDMDIDEFRRVLRQVIAEEMGVTRPALGQRWQGGEMVIIPGKEGTQEKRIPLETFFHKIVMVRDKLRLLEAKLNSHSGLTAEDKVQLQAYITGCYGSLTTFNVLFANKDDQFSGASGG